MFRRCLYIKSKSPNYKAFRFSSSLSEDEILHKSYQGLWPRFLSLNTKDSLDEIFHRHLKAGVIDSDGLVNRIRFLKLYTGTHRAFSSINFAHLPLTVLSLQFA